MSLVTDTCVSANLTSNTKNKSDSFAITLFFNSMLLPHLCFSCQPSMPLSLLTQSRVQKVQRAIKLIIAFFKLHHMIVLCGKNIGRFERLFLLESDYSRFTFERARSV